MKTILYIQLSITAFPGLQGQPQYTTYSKATDRCWTALPLSFLLSFHVLFHSSFHSCFSPVLSPPVILFLISSLFSPSFVPLLSFSVSEILLCHWWKATAASEIASVLASRLKGEITANEWSDNRRLRRGEMERWADGSVQFWDDMLPQRPIPPCAADLLQGKKNAFILFQTPQKKNEAAGLNYNLETGKMWTIGTRKHRFRLFGLRVVCFFSPLFSLAYK